MPTVEIDEVCRHRRIFISSTSTDLKPHRARVAEVLEKLQQQGVRMGPLARRPVR